MNACCKTLPEGWVLHDTIDLKNNKKQFWLVQGISLLLAAAFVAAGCFLVHPKVFFEDSPARIWALLALIVGMIIYIVLHELTHGVFLASFTKTKPKFGFLGWAAYCGNEAYCNKPCYAVVALAPVVVWGIVFGVLNAFFRTGVWFWLVWFLQTVNVSGAAGDLFVTFKLFGYPKEILVQDTGISMKVFRRATAEEAAAQLRAQEETGENND